MEDGEISVIEVGEGVANFAQRLRRFFHGLGLGGDAGHDLPENFFTERHLADADDTEGEHLAQAVAIEDGIVITFLRAKGFDVQHDLVQAAELDIGIGWNGECFRSVEVELSDAEDVKDEHAEVASDGASGFGDEIRVRNFGFVADLGDHLDHVRAVFLQGIVAAVGAGTGTVVVDGQSAAEVDESHFSAFLDELHVDASRLHGALADGLDFRNLRPLVEVEEPHPVELVMGPQVVEQPHELREREPERAAVAGGIGPMAAAFGGEADAHAEQWFDAEGGGAFHDQGQFIGHFEDDDDLQAHFAGAEGEVDELAIFVAIADDEGLGVVHVGQGGEEFRFAAGLEAVLELASEAGHFADDLVLLIDLDGVDAAVLATIILFSDGASERDIELLDA